MTFFPCITQPKKIFFLSEYLNIGAVEIRRPPVPALVEESFSHTFFWLESSFASKNVGVCVSQAKFVKIFDVQLKAEFLAAPSEVT